MPPPGVTGPIKPFIKRKKMDMVDRSAKKSKVVLPTVKETPLATQLPPAAQLPPSLRHGTGKGLMMAKGPVAEKRPPSSAKIRDMPLANYHSSSRTITMRT